jgi:hypothetical protein
LVAALQNDVELVGRARRRLDSHAELVEKFLGDATDAVRANHTAIEACRKLTQARRESVDAVSEDGVARSDSPRHRDRIAAALDVNDLEGVRDLQEFSSPRCIPPRKGGECREKAEA